MIIPEVEMQVKGIIDNMDKKQELLSKFRIDEAKFRLEYDKIKDTAEQEVTDLLIALSQEPDIAESVDPRTGKANADWAKLLTQSKLQAHPRFIELATIGREAEEKYLMAQIKSQDMADQIGTIRYQSGLLAALLNFMSGTPTE